MSERADTARARAIAESPELALLRPVLDPVLDLVRIDCPRCRAQDTDPQRIWRPARLLVRGRKITYLCDACGAQHERNQ